MRIIEFVRNTLTAVVLFICLIVITAVFLFLEVYRRMKLIPDRPWRINGCFSRGILHIIGNKTPEKENEA